MRVVVLVLGLLVSGCVRSPDVVITSPCEAPFAVGEFGSDHAMVVALSRPPALGETAVLSAGICARKATRAAVSLRLPDGFEWRRAPEETVVTTSLGYSGCEQLATGEWDLAAMTPAYLAGTVAVTRPGPAQLAGSVSPTDGPGPGNAASVFVTVGLDRRSSHFGFPALSGDTSATSVRPVPHCA